MPEDMTFMFQIPTQLFAATDVHPVHMELLHIVRQRLGDTFSNEEFEDMLAMANTRADDVIAARRGGWISLMGGE